jgi:hypothetical protein
VLGFFAAYLPSGDYFIERAGQIALGLAAVLYFLLDSALRAREEERLEARVDQAERAVVEHPDKPGPLWDAARARLELYFQRNLAQTRSIFWITCIMMVAGFVMIAYGLSTVQATTPIGGSALAVGAGVLTEFIAATFVVVYKTTMAQTNTFVGTLERINAVGMAIQILDSIPDTEADMKNQSRASLVMEIMRHAPGIQSTNRGG